MRCRSAWGKGEGWSGWVVPKAGWYRAVGGILPYCAILPLQPALFLCCALLRQPALLLLCALPLLSLQAALPAGQRASSPTGRRAPTTGKGSEAPKTGKGSKRAGGGVAEEEATVSRCKVEHTHSCTHLH